MTSVLSDWVRNSDDATFYTTTKSEITLPFLNSSYFITNVRATLTGRTEIKIEAEPLFNTYQGFVRVLFLEPYTVIWHHDETCRWFKHTFVLYTT